MKMWIALDYDGTYTRHPEFWLNFVSDALKHGHTVVCVTMRHDHEMEDFDMRLSDKIRVIHTFRNQKREFCEAKGFKFDVWIDDMPEAIV